MSILDNAKEVANAVHEIKNLDLYEKVLALTHGIMDMVQENRDLHAENHDLKEKFKLREKMTFKEPFYFQEGDETPFCPACWELKTIPVHLIFSANRTDAIYWHCPVCRQSIAAVKDRNPPRNHPSPRISEWS